MVIADLPWQKGFNMSSGPAILVEVLGELGKLFGGGTESLRRILADLGHHFVIEIGDDLFHFFFNAWSNRAEMFIHLAPEIFKGTTGAGGSGILWHDYLTVVPKKCLSDNLQY
jgi:hypothetical protein